MKNLWERMGTVSARLFHKKQFRKWFISSIVVLFVLQLYFVREMLAAEVLFGMFFLVLLVLFGIFYAVGAMGERGLDLAEAGIRAVARSARWSYSALEDLSKRQFRHRHSQSAP
jgi:energy-coupling factor transporter transmembrane protein EcfT